MENINDLVTFEINNLISNLQDKIYPVEKTNKGLEKISKLDLINMHKKHWKFLQGYMFGDSKSKNLQFIFDLYGLSVSERVCCDLVSKTKFKLLATSEYYLLDINKFFGYKQKTKHTYLDKNLMLIYNKLYPLVRLHNKIYPNDEIISSKTVVGIFNKCGVNMTHSAYTRYLNIAVNKRKQLMKNIFGDKYGAQ